jgi:cyclopropane-fatty-acyl-phospholipid synthase
MPSIGMASGSVMVLIKPKFTILIKYPSVVQTVLSNVLTALPEAYTGDRIDIDGDFQEFIRLCYDIDFSQLRLSVVQRIVLVFRAMGERNSLSGAKRKVSHHYDLGNEFFRSWLDELMVYSCAYFENQHDDLNTAQRQKLQYILNKLQLEPGQQLLDIGCGWGALTRYAASSRSVKVLEITLSDEQRALCETCLKEANLQDRVEIRLQDYRQLGGRIFDRVVSVGMMEHIGQSYVSEYVGTVAKSAAPSGRGVFQWITKNKPGEVTPWIRKRIFPGMYLPTLAEISTAMAAADLHIVDVENLRAHYAMTLDAWSDRFKRSTDVIRRMYDERFVRMWRISRAWRIVIRSAVAGEQLARPVAHQVGLVIDRTHRHEPLARPSRRLANRRRVDRVVLVAPDIGLHMRGRQQSNLVPEFDQRPPPMMRRGARLHRHHTRRQLGENGISWLRVSLRHNDLAPRIDRVNLKHPFRQIETNPRDSRQIPDRLAHGRLPFRWGFDNDHLGTLMPFGAPSTPSFAEG